MGEPSGEIIAPPQVTEARENGANFGLSVNGSQIIALTNLEYLKEHGFRTPMKPTLMDRLRAYKSRPALRRLNAIKELILEGKTQAAINLLNQSLALANPIAGVKNNKFLEGTEAVEEYKKEAIDALSKDIPIEEAFKRSLKIQ